MRDSYRKFYNILVVILILVPLLILIGWLPFFPAKIPAHYTGGAIDRWGSKFELIMIPMCNILLFVIVHFALKAVRQRMKTRDEAICMIVASVIYAGITFMTFYFSAKAYIIGLDKNGAPAQNFHQLLALYFSMLFATIGGAMPFAPQNSFVGIRTTATLKDKNVWKYSNRIGGVILLFCSLVSLVFNLLYSNNYINIIIFAIPIILGVVFCLFIPSIVEKKLKKNKPPAEALENE